MFKKLKDKIADEVKANPRLQGTLDSVNQLAAQTYSAFNKEGSGSRESLTSLASQLSLSTLTAGDQDKQVDNVNGELVSWGSPAAAAVTAGGSSSSSGQFFSLGEDDDPISLSNANSPTKTPTQTLHTTGGSMTSTPRGRRLSSGSTSEAALFPIYEDPDLDQDTIPLFSDMESVAGSEAGWADDSSTQLSAVSKEQLVNMLSKMRSRYHKYKGRYTDLSKAFRELQNENKKVKDVMQQTQDKALRRISELKEQAALDKEAKAHLEEELRAELEEKQHVISTLNTKVALLKKESSSSTILVDLEHKEDIENGAKVNGAYESDDKLNQLPELCDNMSIKSEESDKVFQLEDKIKRLESLLSKCKENIKANKNKLTALTEVKEQLATDLENKEAELLEARQQCKVSNDELTILRKKEEAEEVQIAEVKLAMHSEMIIKDEEIGKLRVNLNNELADKEKLENEVENLQKEIKEMGLAQESLEKRMEEERKAAMEELSRGKEAVLDQEKARMENEKKKEISRELERQAEEFKKKLRDVEEEGRLGREELQLRLSALSKNENTSNSRTKDLESKLSKLTNDNQVLNDQLLSCKKQISSLEEMKNTLTEIKAEKIILEENVKELGKNKSRVSELENTLSSDRENYKVKLDEKDKELAECLTSMAKMEDSIREQKEKVEQAELQLSSAHEEHKQNLENLKLQLENNENSELNQVGILLEKHKIEMEEKDSEMKKIHQKFLGLQESSKELQQRLDYNLESSMKTEEELEAKVKSLTHEIQSFKTNLDNSEVNLKEAEDNLTLKAEELRDANDKVEDLQILLEKMQSNEAKAKELKDLLDLKVLELRDANEELEEFKRIADERGNSKMDLEKELQSYKEQVSSRQALHDQMVTYQKELQEMNSSLEKEKSEVQQENTALKEQIIEKDQSIVDIRKCNEDEICKLKQDLEMKIRHEREKENSHKEFQKQSIEYEKKLQDQIEEKNQLLDKIKSDFESQKKEFVTQKDSCEKEIKNLENKLTVMNQAITEKDAEIANLLQKCELIEQLLSEKEKSLLDLEQSTVGQIQSLTDEINKLKDNRTQLNEILEEQQKQNVSLKDQVSDIEKLKTDNLKLSKSRDRLKSLLDEKEKSLKDLEEKEKLNGTRQTEATMMKQKLETLTSEVTELTNSNSSLSDEISAFKQSLETSNSEVCKLQNENSNLASQLENIKNQKLQLTEEKLELSKSNEKIELRLIELQENEAKLKETIDQKKIEYEVAENLKSELSNARAELKSTQEEVLSLQSKVNQTETMNDVSGLKEENLILSERCSQYQEEKALIEKKCEEKWKSENDKLEKVYERQKLKLEKVIESQQEEISRLQNQEISEQTEDKIKLLVKELEKKMAIMDSDHQDELDRVQENHEIELAKIVGEHRELTNRLSSDLRDKVNQLEQVGSEHERSLELLHDQMTEQLEMRDHQHAQQMDEMTASHRARLASLEQEMKSRSDWDWDENGSHESHVLLTDDSPAIFGVPTVNNTPHPASSNNVKSGQSIEDNPEWEYLRNILYEYMCGRQPLILAKVLSAIVRFTPDQVNAVLKAEEKKQSYLSSIGLS